MGSEMCIRDSFSVVGGGSFGRGFLGGGIGAANAAIRACCALHARDQANVGAFGEWLPVLWEGFDTGDASGPIFCARDGCAGIEQFALERRWVELAKFQHAAFKFEALGPALRLGLDLRFGL